MARTMIDLLKRGNQELFYSAILAWLLDPTESHGLGNHFIDGFVAAARAQGFDLPEDGWDNPQVDTEARERRNRYDIAVKANDGRGFVVENKTKSIGSLDQIAGYEGEERPVIPLGLSNESFGGSPRALTYFHVREMLNDLDTIPNDGFGHLVRHFREHLDHELERLDYVERLADGDLDLDLREKLQAEWGANELSENELRYLNLLFLNITKRSLEEVFGGIQWRSNKNQSSGAWLAADQVSAAGRFSWNGSFLRAVKPGRVWVHIELHKGVLYAGDDRTVGQIQLRAKSGEEQSNRALYSNVRNAVSAPHIKWGRRPADSYKSFKAAYVPLKGASLSAPELRNEVTRFMEVFGTFS